MALHVGTMAIMAVHDVVDVALHVFTDHVADRDSTDVIIL